jgi:hypothetical protein
MKFLTIVLLILAGFSIGAYAQVSATATATATIVTPIAISKTVDMNFGNVAVQPSNGGTVVLNPSGTRSGTSGVTLPAASGTVTAASFNVTGTGTYTYAITLPSTATIIDDNAMHTMNVDTWTSNPSGTGNLTAGSQTLNVGATLYVGAGQEAGIYVSDTPFTVIVNYN